MGDMCLNASLSESRQGAAPKGTLITTAHALNIIEKDLRMRHDQPAWVCGLKSSLHHLFQGYDKNFRGDNGHPSILMTGDIGGGYSGEFNAHAMVTTDPISIVLSPKRDEEVCDIYFHETTHGADYILQLDKLHGQIVMKWDDIGQVRNLRMGLSNTLLFRMAACNSLERCPTFALQVQNHREVPWAMGEALGDYLGRNYPDIRTKWRDSKLETFFTESFAYGGEGAVSDPALQRSSVGEFFKNVVMTGIDLYHAGDREGVERLDSLINTEKGIAELAKKSHAIRNDQKLYDTDFLLGQRCAAEDALCIMMECAQEEIYRYGPQNHGAAPSLRIGAP